MTREEFDALPEYSCTMPTGPRIGFKWKHGRPYYMPSKWWLGECIADAAPAYVDTLWRKIDLIDDHADASAVLALCDA
jgi:hypothetical protein